MVNAGTKLDSVYNSINPSISFRGKLKIKYNAITDIVTGINRLSLHNKQRYTFTFPKAQLPNNAWFMSYKRYRVNQNDFDAQLQKQFKGRIELFITDLKSK
jgi:hypothetical protein